MSERFLFFFFVRFEEGAGVALEAGELGALDGALAKARGVIFLRHLKQLGKIGVNISLARLESLFIRRLLEAIPGAHVLADVAAVKPALHLRGYVGRQLLRAKLNRRIR